MSEAKRIEKRNPMNTIYETNKNTFDALEEIGRLSDLYPEKTFTELREIVLKHNNMRLVY